MSLLPETTILPPIIRRKLNRLGRLLRLYTTLDGIAQILFTVTLIFLADYILDRLFEFPLLLRVFLLPVLISIVGWFFWKHILCRCFASFSLEHLAGTLEHYVPHLNEALITVVERGSIEPDGKDSDSFHPELMQQTMNVAVAALRGVDVRRFFRVRPICLRFLLSILFAAGIMIASTYVETIPTWFSRNILLSQQEYPRRSELLVDGFQNGRVRIGRGDSFTLFVRANTEMPVVPESIRVQIGTRETGFRTQRIDQFQEETRQGVRYRLFSLPFQEMLDTVTLHIRGGDTTLNDLCIEVVPTPALFDWKIEQTFPAYMQRSNRSMELSGRMMIPDGTSITISASSTKPLRHAVAVVHQKENVPKEITLHTPDDSSEHISLSLTDLRKDGMIDFQLLDNDSLPNRYPINVEWGMTPDQLPVITARLEGIGSAITPEAVLPIVGEITDDYGLASALFRYAVEPSAAEADVLEDSPSPSAERKPTEGTIPVADVKMGQTLFPLNQSFSVLPLSVLPGSKLRVSVEARDQYDLDSAPRGSGAGSAWTLEVVTPEQLKTLLETQEISLRQRFEVVIGEVDRTKNILTEFTLLPTDPQIQEAEALTLKPSQEETNQDNTDENDTETILAERQRELEEQKRKILETINAEQAELGQYHLSRMLRDTRKEIYDLSGILTGFQMIRQEMINNKIFSEEERRRIDQKIMTPIQDLTRTDFPETDRLIDELNKKFQVREESQRPAALMDRQNILEQFDRTLQKMTAIRDEMASMESFREAVELLRTIIKQQQELRNETMEERNQRLRNLLE